MFWKDIGTIDLYSFVALSCVISCITLLIIEKKGSIDISLYKILISLTLKWVNYNYSKHFDVFNVTGQGHTVGKNNDHESYLYLVM